MRKLVVARLSGLFALLLVVGLLPAAAGPAAAAVQQAPPVELHYACAQPRTGDLRLATSASDCSRYETLVTFDADPVQACAGRNGLVYLRVPHRPCRPTELTLPPATGVVFFCAAKGSGRLRLVPSLDRCPVYEQPVTSTQRDTAPAVVGTVPADGATHVATTVDIVVTFSEPVTSDPDPVTLVCNGVTEPYTASGLPGTTLTIDPDDALAPGVECSLTVRAQAIHDTDTIDPPDTLERDHTITFTTDAAPALLSTSPAADATQVSPDTSIVLTFSEPVDVAADAFELACAGTTQAVAVSGSGTATITIDPAADLPVSVTCTLTAPAAAITDVDHGDPPDALTAPIDLSFATLDEAPRVTATTPADQAEQVATTTDVTVQFSEPVALAPGAFTLSCAGTAQPFAVTGSGTATITLDPDADLAADTGCTVTMVASAVSDLDGVGPVHPVADHTFSFTTDAPPAVTSSTPAAGSTGVDTGADVIIRFTEPVAVTSASFRFECNGTAVPFTLAGSGTATITLTPAEDLPGTAGCTVTVVAAQVSDTDAGDPPDTMVADVTVDFTTVDAAPTVVSTTPQDGATSVATGSDIVVTFSEPVTTTAAAFAIACPTGTAVPFALTGSPGTTITLDPVGLLPAGATCTVTITGSGVLDTDPIDPPDAMAADHTFTFTVTPNAAPTDLTLSPASIQENEPAGTTVGTLTATDPDVGDTVTYTLVTGVGDADNAAFAIDGTTLTSAESFDFEAKSSYSVRVRATDAGGAFFEKSFTITVVDVNEAPSGITLSGTSVAENQPAGTVVGTLSATDPDAGQTHTFSVVTSGCGGTYADGSAFTVSGTSLVTTASLDFESKSTYAVCLRVVDNGVPALAAEQLVTITVTDVNEAPVVGADAYSGAIGNTLAVVGTTGTGPQRVLTGAVLLANDSDPEGDTISAVAETVSSSGGGSATINADGSFTFLPGVGDTSQTDTFTYRVTDSALTTSGTVSVSIGADLVWYVDNSRAAGDGRSTSPLSSLSPLDGAGGAGDPDGPGDHVFVYQGSGAYAGGLALEAGQRLFGQPHGLVVAGTTLVAPGGTAPVLTNAAGNGLDLAAGVEVQGIHVDGASADGIHGTDVDSAVVGTATTVLVSNSGADGVDLTGGTSGTVTIAAGIAASAQRSVNVANRHGGTAAFSGAITGPGITLTANAGGAIAFTGPLAVATTSAPAFTATGGGVVTATDAASTLASTTGTTLTVDATTIGAAGLAFRSISANGAVNGIRLNATGTTGGLRVLGGGSVARGGDASGGTIQDTTGAGVLLTNTSAVSLNNVTVTRTPVAPGVDGTGVSGFAFTNGTVTGSGTTSHSPFDANIAFNDNGATVANVTGALTVSNSVLTGAYQGGLDVLDNSGTISSLQVTDNTITSPVAAADSASSGVRILAYGSTTTAATVSGGSVSGNTITGFPNGAGIMLQGGNAASAAAPSGGLGSSGTPVTVNGNLVRGVSAANRMGTNCILVSMQGRGMSWVDVTNNGSVASPLGLNAGNCLSVNSQGAHVLTSTVTGNVVRPEAQISGTYGIAGGAAQQTLADTSVADSAVLNATISNNTVSATTGSGIRFLANSRGTLNARIQGNSVAAPTGGIGSGIRVDSGTSTGTAVDTKVCAQLSGNTSAGAGASPGIGLRKQGSVATTNVFGLVGLSPSPATGAQASAYVASLNPASAGGVLNIAGEQYVSCTLPF